MRRILAIGSSAVLVLGLAIGVTPAASAADLGTVTVTYNSGPMDYSVSPSVLSGLGGDIFTLRNTMISVNAWVSLVNSSGSVTLGGVNCATDASCRVIDVAGGTATGLFTVTTPGTIAVRRTLNNGSTYSTIGTLTINAGGSGSAGAVELAAWLAANPTFNATANANGGSCSGITAWQRIPYIAAFPGVFTLPTSNQCTRSGYLLVGWATTANTSNALYSAGDTYAMGNADVTLYAVWRPNGIEIVYDANVGLETQCLSNGTNLTTAAERQTTPTVVPALSAAAAQAPCTPPGHTLNGWSLTGAGPLTLVKGAALPASFTGTSQTLYAKWEPDRFDLSVQADSLINNGSLLRICAGVSQLVTFTATKNGVAAAGQIIDVEIARTGASSTTQRLTTDDSGRVQVNFTLDRNYTPQVVSGSFANQVAKLIFVERDSLQCVETITITGARTTVSGKPGIIVNGTTTGFKKGETVVPYIRFPGETTFTPGSARPEMGADGSVSWSRKTGKRVTVYFATEDGSVTSNEVTIQTN